MTTYKENSIGDIITNSMYSLNCPCCGKRGTKGRGTVVVYRKEKQEGKMNFFVPSEESKAKFTPKGWSVALMGNDCVNNMNPKTF